MANAVLRSGKLTAGSYTLKHTGPQIDALLTKTEGLYNYDDTEIRSLIRNLELTKVDKEEGKGLSTNDFTDEYKNMVSRTNDEVVEARGGYTSLDARLDDMSGGGGTTDYLDLINKPQINGHELVGDLSPEDLGIQQVQVDWNETAPSAISYIRNKPEIPTILYGTTESWDAQATLVSQQKTIYVYTDYQVDEGKNIPGFKVGDGITLLINLPFTGSEGGVTDAERESWNNKVTAFIDPEDEENLIFSND